MIVVADHAVFFGALLRQHRTAAGLSQKELADAAGLSRRGISDLERGVRRRPYPATRRRLSAALGLSGAERAELLAAAEDDVWVSASGPPRRTSGTIAAACVAAGRGVVSPALERPSGW